MQLRLGFCGAHRTGKSTLAADVSKAVSTPFVESTVSNIAKENGFDFNKDNSFARRVEFQNLILDKMSADYSAHPAFVSDRTPLDAAAYLLADVRAHTGDPETQELVCQYIDRAMRLTTELFDIVILVPPAINVEPMEGKPVVNPAYQAHHHQIVRGMLFDPDLDVFAGQILLENIDHSNRLKAVAEFIWDWEARRVNTVQPVLSEAA